MRASTDGIRTNVRWVIPLRLHGQHGRKPFVGQKTRRQPTKKLQTLSGEQSQRCVIHVGSAASHSACDLECERNNVGRTLFSGSLLVPCPCDQPVANHATRHNPERCLDPLQRSISRPPFHCNSHFSSRYVGPHTSAIAEAPTRPLSFSSSAGSKSGPHPL